MAEDLQSLKKSLLGESPGAIVKGMEKAGASITNLRNDLLQEDPGFDQSGVPDFGLRSGLSRADTDEERKAFLNEWTGPKGWTQDRFGAYALTPAGMTRLGYPHKGKPVLIDEPWSLTRYDIADLAGEAPGIAGATAAGLATGGAGFVPGVLAVAGGEMIGKAGGEAVEHFRGENLQTLPEVAGDIGKSGLAAAGGEAVFRGALAPIGRKMLRPRANKMTPERTELAQTATELGTRPAVTQIAPSGLLGRAQSMANMIFGNPLARGNAKAITKEMNRLQSATGARGSGARLSVGDQITKDVSRSRGALSRWASQVAGKIDDMTGGYAVVPTARIKEQAKEILDSLPRKKPVTTGPAPASYFDDLTGTQVSVGGTQTRQGKVIFASKELVTELENIRDLPDFYTMTEVQQMTERLYSAISDETIVPGIGGRNARLLWKSATQSYEDVADPGLREVVMNFRSRYGREIRRFDNAVIQRIMRSPKYAGRLEPEQIVGAIFRKGQTSKLARVKAVVTPGTWNKVRGAAMEEVLGKLSKRGDDPFEVMFQGKQFLEALDSYGKGTLTAMFGKGLTADLYRLGQVTQLVTKEMKMSGGIVAASIALHPMKNLGRLARIFTGAQFLNTRFAVRWLTEGLEAPKTRLGAAAIARLAVFVGALAEQHTADPLPVQQDNVGRQPAGGVAADKL